MKPFGPRQENLVLIAYASSEGSGEPAHPCSLARTSAARSYKHESRGTFRQKARSLAPMNGWTCAVKICNDGMLEDTNSLGGAHLQFTGILLVIRLQNNNFWKIWNSPTFHILNFPGFSDLAFPEFFPSLATFHIVWVHDVDAAVASGSSPITPVVGCWMVIKLLSQHHDWFARPPLSFTWAASWQNKHNGVCAQPRLRSAWASALSDQSSLSAWRNLGPLATH